MLLPALPKSSNSSQSWASLPAVVLAGPFGRILRFLAFTPAPARSFVKSLPAIAASQQVWVLGIAKHYSRKR